MLCNVSQSSNCSAHSTATSATRVPQAEGWTTVPPSVPLALLRVSQVMLLSYPCNLPNQHILQTLRNHPKSYTDPLELHCPRETALGTFLRVFALKRTLYEMPSVEQGSGALSAIFCKPWRRSQYCIKPKSYFKYGVGVKVPCEENICGWCETGCSLSRFWKEL